MPLQYVVIHFSFAGEEHRLAGEDVAACDVPCAQGQTPWLGYVAEYARAQAVSNAPKGQLAVLCNPADEVGTEAIVTDPRDTPFRFLE